MGDDIITAMTITEPRQGKARQGVCGDAASGKRFCCLPISDCTGVESCGTFVYGKVFRRLCYERAVCLRFVSPPPFQSKVSFVSISAPLPLFYFCSRRNSVFPLHRAISSFLSSAFFPSFFHPSLNCYLSVAKGIKNRNKYVKLFVFVECTECFGSWKRDIFFLLFFLGIGLLRNVPTTFKGELASDCF